MAVTVTSKPSSISFAGNPILVKVVTNLSDKTFLKICLRLSAELLRNGVIHSGENVFDFSMPVSKKNTHVTFNLSSAILSMFTQINPTYLYEYNTEDYSTGYVRYSFKVWDEYLDSDNHVVSSENSSAVSGGPFNSIPGAYTDLQRIVRPVDTAVLLGHSRILSVKPDTPEEGEFAPKNHPLVVPIYCGSDNRDKIIAYKKGEEQQAIPLGYYNVRSNETTWSSISLSGLDPGEYKISFTNLPVRPFLVNVIPEQPFATYFQFVNRLGGLESITCYSRRKFLSDIESERNTLYGNTDYHPTARYSKHVKSDVQRIAMSTGPISRMWAEWFMQEFFVAEHCWMLRDYGKMEPVIIEIDDSITLYDEGEAELIDIEFEVVQAYNGYIFGGYL